MVKDITIMLSCLCDGDPVFPYNENSGMLGLQYLVIYRDYLFTFSQCIQSTFVVSKSKGLSEIL